MASHQGFAAVLVHIACTEGLAAPEVRQLAAVVLKHHVRAHWCEEAEAFTSPCICDGEKAALRAALPTGLRDVSPLIRTAISAAIACIATWDWPDQWPELLDQLLRPLEDAVRAAGAACNWTADADAMSGSLRCLELCAGDLGEAHLGGALQRLLPLLLALYQQPDPSAARIRALSAVVARKLLERISTYSTADELIGDVGRKHLRLWAEALLSALVAPAAENNTSGNEGGAPLYDLSIGTLRLVELFVYEFPMALQPLADRLLPALGVQMSRLHAEHTTALAHPSADVDAERPCDVDGNALGLEAHAAQLFDVFAAISLSSRLSKLLKPALPELFFALLSFVRIPRAAQAVWEADLESYLQDEDEDSFAVSTRVAAQQLMIEVLDSMGQKALGPLCVAVERALAESEACRNRSSPDSHGDRAQWWLWREAALVALSIGADLFCRAGRRARQQGSAPPLNVEELLSPSGPLLADLQRHMPPLLRGRALCAAARFTEGVSEASLRPFLEAALAALDPAEVPLVRACACRALSAFAARQPPISVLREAAPVVLKAVAALLPIGGEDATLLTVETLTALLRHCSEEVLTDVQAWLSPALLSTWGTRWQDPLLSSALVDAFRGLARSPAALVRMIPLLVPVLSQALQLAAVEGRVQHQTSPAGAQGASAPEAHESEGERTQVIEAAIDLIGMMLKRWPSTAALPDSISSFLLPALLDLLCVSSDEEVLIRSVQCLCRFVRRGALGQANEPQLAAWHATLRRLMQPDLPEQVRHVFGACPCQHAQDQWASAHSHGNAPFCVQVAACVPALLCDMLEHAPALFAGEQLGSLLVAVVLWLRPELRLGLTQQVINGWTLPNGLVEEQVPSALPQSSAQ